MKKKAIVIDDVDNADSIMDDGYRRFMVNAVNEHTSSKTDKINGPLICLDDDDDDDDDNDEIKIDENYKVFLDHLRDDNKLGPLFVYGNGVSDTRKFEIFSGDSKRSKLENDNPMDKRVSQQMKKENVGFKAETSRVLTREDIQRDNRVAERRKRRIAELEEAQRTSKAVPFVKSQQVNKVGNISELKAETLWDIPLVYFVNKDVQFVSDTQRDNKVSERRKSKTDELKTQTLRRAVPLVRAEEDILRDNRIAEPRIKRKMSENKAAGTSSVAPVERVKRVIELKDVDETSRKKNEKESVVVVDKDYMSYLTWLVDSLKASTTKPMANLQKDLSNLDPPISDTLKESTMAIPEKDLPVKVKIEQDLESWSDDSDIIAISDSPFLDGEGTPFVASKKVVDLDEVSKEDESSSFWFRKELMNVLEKPYNERELKQLHHEASIHRKMTRSRELRKGRETDYETDELGLSYFERFTDFEKEYKHVDGVDKARALKLLRGFFFYLKNVSHDGAFKPWKKNQWWQP